MSKAFWHGEEIEMKRKAYWSGVAMALVMALAFAMSGCPGIQYVPQCAKPDDCGGQGTCQKGVCTKVTPPNPDGGSPPDAGKPDPRRPEPTRPEPTQPEPPTIRDAGAPDASPDQSTPEQPIPEQSPGCVLIQVLSPPHAEAGKVLELGVHGKGFMPGSAIVFDGKVLPTLRIRRDELSAEIDLTAAQPGKVQVWVRCPNGQKSNALSFEIKPPSTPGVCKPLRETFTTPHYRYDILFVVDSSGSMADQNQALQAQAKSFFDVLHKNKYDYQIGVTTMDVTGTKHPAGCLLGTTRIISKSTPNPVATLQSNLKAVGFSGSSKEAGLEAAYQALSPARLNDAKCNKGFLRPDSKLKLIFVTDEKEQSGNTPQFYNSFLLKLRPKANALSGHLIAGELSANPCGVNLFQTYPRYVAAFANAGINLLPFCSLKRLTLSPAAQGGPTLQSVFPLKKYPKASSLKVWVNGASIPNDRQTGFYYEPVGNTVNFALNSPHTSPAWPGPNAKVEIEYLVEADVRERFVQRGNSKLDILFVVDNSASMADEQDALANQVAGFISRLGSLKIDYQIGVTTTDTTGKTLASGCLRGTTKVIHAGLKSTATSLLQQALKAGTQGSTLEQGLKAAYDALSPARLNDPKCNQHFLRKDAALAIVFLSDEDDASPQTNGAYIKHFQGLKPAGGPPVFVHALVGPAPSGCRAHGSSGAHGARYLAVQQAIGGIHQSICQLSGALDALLDHSAQTSLRFPLKEKPEPASIRVFVSGKEVKGWTYDAKDNAILFTKATAPPLGRQLWVQYLKAGQCVPK